MYNTDELTTEGLTVKEARAYCREKGYRSPATPDSLLVLYNTLKRRENK